MPYHHHHFSFIEIIYFSLATFIISFYSFILSLSSPFTSLLIILGLRLLLFQFRTMVEFPEQVVQTTDGLAGQGDPRRARRKSRFEIIQPYQSKLVANVEQFGLSDGTQVLKQLVLAQVALQRLNA